MVARILVIVGVVVVAVTVYALADIYFVQRSRVRTLNKVLWAVIVVAVPFIGSVLWFLLGKARKGKAGGRVIAPDDDPNFRSPNTESVDERIARLEEELRKLDDEDGNAPGPARD